MSTEFNKPEVKLLMVGDVHVSDRPPSTRTDSYREDILKKLLEIGQLAKMADAVVFVGDIFHSKKPRNTSHQTVRAVAQILGSYPVPVFILPGNHDYRGRNHGTLSDHPLGTVALMPNISLFGTKGKPNALVTSLDSSCILHGVREEEGVEAFDISRSQLEDNPVVVVAHSAIFPPGKTPGVWEAFDATEIAGQYELTGAPLTTWYGHIHEPHGTYLVPMADGNAEFTNLGAISRGSLHEEGALDRRPAVGLLTIGEGYHFIDGHALQSARKADEVFRITEVEEERTTEARRNMFVDALSAAEVEVFSVERAADAISRHPGVEQPVRDRALELIAEVTG